MQLRSQLRLPLLLPLFLTTLSSAAVHRRAVKNDFSDYPSGTQQCLDDASDDSRCSGNTVPQMNQCLCSNGGDFVTNAAKCIAREDPDDMESTWEALSLHCSDSNTPLSISKKGWMAELSSLSTTTSAKTTTSNTATKSTMTTTSAGHTTTATVTTTPAATSSPPPEDTDAGLSGGARIAVIAGSVAGGVAVLVAAAFILFRYRKRRNGAAYQEVHVMGAQSPYSRMSKAPAPYGSPDLGGHASYQSTTVSDLGTASDPRGSWHPSPDGQAIPWSPSAFEAVKQNPGFGNLHQPPPVIHEMSTDGERPISMSPSAAVEMPAIQVISPTVSPTSRYSGADWDSQLPHVAQEPTQMPQEPRRYEPYRPAR
ncbi:hypothetical protein KVR01_005900 [Diaporthe batatas]|uniref:uncharacterized protein n=1 Tax=Diaporthe batatas TaxID=748121 RepID=UPI001D05A30F|nr:uncharacterized protein KVR01_005900 [Diaporthe batatas]KAG8163982.1 hypothetical protein KVR01_005900 [Diaporthe batatas]